MDPELKAVLWRQFGGAIDMLANAIMACPDALWSDASRGAPFWYVAYHTLFYLDFYSADADPAFQPPAPFTLSELDPAGPMPERTYSQAELLDYLAVGRERCRARIERLTAADGVEPRRLGPLPGTALELLLYNMRHVQHHTGQLNLYLRQAGIVPPRWVAQVTTVAGR